MHPALTFTIPITARASLQPIPNRNKPPYRAFAPYVPVPCSWPQLLLSALSFGVGSSASRHFWRPMGDQPVTSAAMRLGGLKTAVERVTVNGDVVLRVPRQFQALDPTFKGQCNYILGMSTADWVLTRLVGVEGTEDVSRLARTDLRRHGSAPTPPGEADLHGTTTRLSPASVLLEAKGGGVDSRQLREAREQLDAGRARGWSRPHTQWMSATYSRGTQPVHIVLEVGVPAGSLPAPWLDPASWPLPGPRRRRPRISALRRLPTLMHLSRAQQVPRRLVSGVSVVLARLEELDLEFGLTEQAFVASEALLSRLREPALVGLGDRGAATALGLINDTDSDWDESGGDAGAYVEGDDGPYAITEEGLVVLLGNSWFEFLN